MGTADDIFRLAPHDVFPDGKAVVCLEGDGAICHIIDETAPLHTVVAELNAIVGHLVYDGVWVQSRGGDMPPPRMRHAS
jgi:hypothetical protein